MLETTFKGVPIVTRVDGVRVVAPRETYVGYYSLSE